MLKIVKKSGKQVNAYRLGEECPELKALIQQGKLRVMPDGSFMAFSQEALLGQSGQGERCFAGDYIKIDSSGAPYPNRAAFFEANHRHISSHLYEQQPTPLDGWTVQEPMCEEITFLLEKKGLAFHPEDEAHYFTAPLWGTMEAAAKDAVIVFYSITRDETGRIIDADFNLICRDEFEKTYTILSNASLEPQSTL